MSQIKTEADGGPAFPGAHSSIDPRNPGWVGGGMSMRDYFATHVDIGEARINDMAAAEALVGRPIPTDTIKCLRWQLELLARVRYALADAMLKAREH